MHPTIHSEIAQTQIADLHRQANRDRLAQAARTARRRRHEQRRRWGDGRPVTVFARCLYAVLPARSRAT